MTPRIGDTGPDFSFGPLTRTDIVRYAGASGDMNPIHHDDGFAREAGLPTVMAHGMLSAGLLSSFVTRWFGPGSVCRYAVRFRDRVWPGDTLRAEGEVVSLGEHHGRASADLALRLVNQSGTAVITGTATVWLDAELS